VTIDPDSDVLVLPYSSGTTGLPKGVMLTHGNVVANLVQIDAIERPDLRALVGVLPFFHIYGMVAILNFGLMRGATVVTLPRFELEPFLKVLQDWPIKLAHIVPPIALALAKHPCVDANGQQHRCVALRPQGELRDTRSRTLAGDSDPAPVVRKGRHVLCHRRAIQLHGRLRRGVAWHGHGDDHPEAG
jgi:acyl-CoA synthetase (AMP-forming)/AMP-acid ligase II